MKQLITITKNDKVIFDGRIAEIPIKNDFIIKKSIELFDDEDPCIIHQSYVVKEYVDILLKRFKETNNEPIVGASDKEFIAFLDFTELENITISLKRWGKWKSI